MRVRITSPPTEESVDGIPLSQYKVGAVYDVPTLLATLMIVEGWAEPLVESIDPTLPQIRFKVFTPERRRRTLTDADLRTQLGIAADRRRRK